VRADHAQRTERRLHDRPTATRGTLGTSGAGGQGREWRSTRPTGSAREDDVAEEAAPAVRAEGTSTPLTKQVV
jgi:hypothetical protein